MRTSNDVRPIERFDIRFEKGGMGDSIARLPAVRYVARYEHIKSIRLFVQDYFVDFATYLLNDSKIKVFGLGEMERELTERPSNFGSWSDCTIHTTLRTHLTDHAFHTICDCQPIDPDAKLYLKVRYDLPNPLSLKPGSYVVITTGFTAPVREWPAEEVNKVSAWCISKGLTPVFLGKNEVSFLGEHKTQAYFSEKVDFSQGIDLINKTNLLDAAAIIRDALAIVGVDNGLLHVAGCTETPIVAGYTTVDPDHRVPYRLYGMTYTIEPRSECSYCQTKMQFVYNNDFRLCYYNDYQCIKTMNGERFIEKLERILKRGRDI